MIFFFIFKLPCFIVVELKAGKFDPRDAGQINFYLPIGYLVNIADR
ncbi:DUF1016 family protein [Candidatus Dependentiae bacterium]|nr:DUF1016 family protein [Candidatus Dependentiae bacterium]